MKSLGLAATIASLVLTGAAHAESFTKPQTPDEVHHLFAQYFEAKNMAGLQTLFDPEAILITETGAAKGWQEIEAILVGYLEAGGRIETVKSSVHINGDLALISADWRIQGEKEFSGTAHEVMTFRDGGWRYLIDNPNGL